MNPDNDQETTTTLPTKAIELSLLDLYNHCDDRLTGAIVMAALLIHKDLQNLAGAITDP